MSTITIDQSGTVRLWDDQGDLVQAVAIDPETGRSRTVPLPDCLHPMLAPGGICRSCYQQAILPPDEQTLHTERLVVDERGGMLILAAGIGVTVLFVAGAWLLLAWGAVA